MREGGSGGYKEWGLGPPKYWVYRCKNNKTSYHDKFSLKNESSILFTFLN